MRHTRMALAVLASLCIMCQAHAAAYMELVSSAGVEAGGTGDRHWAHAVSGETAYFTVNGFASGGHSANITMVESLGGVQMPSVLMDTTAWATVAGRTTMTTGYGFGISSTDLLFAEGGSDALWKVSLDTGEPSAYVTKDQIQAHTGATSAQIVNGNGIAPNGEMAFFESATDQVLQSTGLGTLTTLATKEELQTVFGLGPDDNPSLVSGFTWDSEESLYFGDSASDGMAKRASDGTLSLVLNVTDITAVTGQSAAGFGDIIFGPDGLVYFYESSSDSILRFDPASAAATLEFFLTEQDLLDGPMASDNVQTLGFYDGNLTFHTFQVDGVASPLYVVPEPASLLLLAVGGVAVVRRRR